MNKQKEEPQVDDILREIDEAIKTLENQEHLAFSYSFEHAILVLLKAVGRLLEDQAETKKRAK